tara:strand:+ start:24 stop:434 length:411 start_codon:yes stop_codon:yes gene_type:complete
MTKSNTVTLNKVKFELSPNQLKNLETVNKVDKRKNNPGRPVNKKSARYKRLAKQAKYALALSKFTQGSKFKLSKEKSETYKYSISSGESYGCIVSGIGSHVCNVDYIGRTKVLGYTFVLNKRVNVELNLKTLVFVK